MSESVKFRKRAIAGRWQVIQITAEVPWVESTFDTEAEADAFLAGIRVGADRVEFTHASVDA